jgi:hypothetical protein
MSTIFVSICTLQEGVCLSKMIVESMQVQVQVQVVQAHDENGQQTYLQFLTICFGQNLKLNIIPNKH